MIKSFQVRGVHWTLRDLILASRDSERIKAIVEKSKYTRDLLTHFRVQDTSQSVCSTLAMELGKFEAIASSWESAPRKFSIGEWMESQKMLVLGNAPKSKKPVRSLNQLLFTSIAKEIISRPGTAKSKHWFFLDELRELGVLNMMNDLMTVGRSKGASMVLGFQDINGLSDEYGNDKSKEIVGQTSNFALLRVNPTQPETQEWASKVAGALRFRERKTSTTAGDKSSSTSTSYETKTEAYFIPSYFSQRLHKTSIENGMLGIYYTKEKLYEQEYSPKVLFTDEGEPPRYNRAPDEVEGYENFCPLDAGNQLLEPWDDSDLERLGILPEDPEDSGGEWGDIANL